MASSLLDRLKEQVSCAICKEHYKDPRLLPCLHTYCKQCLDNLVRTASQRQLIVCPVCRETVEIKPDGVSKLKVNFLINNLLSLVAIHSTEKKDGQTELTCENCTNKEAAKGRCFNCCMFLCNVCFTAHQRLLALKDHQLMTLDELKDTAIPVIEKQLFCEKHKGEVKRLYCNTCQKLACRDCAIIDHRDHKFRFIEDAANEHKETFKTEIKQASNTKNKIEEVLNSVREFKGNVEKTNKSFEKEIDDFIDKQIRALEKKRVVLKRETRTIAAKKMKELAAQEDGLTMHLTGLRSAIEFAEKVLNNGGNSDVLSMSDQVTSRLSQLSEKPFNKNPCQEHRMRLKVNEQMFSDCIEHHIEAVDASIPDPNQCSVVQWSDGRLIKIQGPIKASRGQVLKFVVCINNAFGDKLKFLEDRIEVKTDQKGSGFIGETSLESFWAFFLEGKTLQIQCHEDNTYSFDFSNKWREPVKIDVTIDGGKVQGCPITVTFT